MNQPQKPTWKILTANEIPEIKKLHENKMHYIDIAKHLTISGFRQIRGGEITQSDVSKLMCVHGHRLLKNNGKRKINALAATLDVNMQALTDIGEIMTSGMRDGLKLASINGILNGVL